MDDVEFDDAAPLDEWTDDQIEDVFAPDKTEPAPTTGSKLAAATMRNARRAAR